MTISHINLSKIHQNAFLKSKDQYEQKLKAVQKKLQLIQTAYFHQKKRAIIVFEGWDASGKGGTIRRLTEKLDPRGYHVYPIAAPSVEEQGKHYLYRFWQKLPAKGSLAIFDRSWYGRVLVERVEGLASKEEWQRAYKEINDFEKMLTDDGVKVIKIFLHISAEEQLLRFLERMQNPLKRWKLTFEDLRNRQNWKYYEKALGEMFLKTSKKNALWHVIPANFKWYTRITALEYIAKKLSERIDITPPRLDAKLYHVTLKQLGVKEQTLLKLKTRKHTEK